LKRRVWPLLLLVVLLLAGVSSAFERDGSWTPARVGGFVVLEGDVHAHSILAGALPTPIDLALLAKSRRLDFVAVVEHNSLVGALWTEAVAGALAPEVIVVPSTEITTRSYHALAIGLRAPLDSTRPLRELADETHRQGGVLVAAHPVRHYWDAFLPLAREGRLDGVEAMHPIRRFVRPWRSVWRGEDLPAFWAEASKAAGRPLAALGGSDYHGLSALGTCRSIVLAKDKSLPAILEAIRAGRAVSAREDGGFDGPPEWIELLRRAGYRARDPRHGYGEASQPAQAMAWAVLAVLLLGMRVRRTVGAAVS
jgi:hypothetical protein